MKKLKSIFGSGSKTKDEEFTEQNKVFSEDNKEFEKLRKLLDKVNKDTSDVIDEYQRLSGLITAVLQGEEGCSLAHDYETAVQESREIKFTTMDDPTRKVQEAITYYMMQYGEMSSRIKERNKRCSAMDKLTQEANHYRNKSDPRLAATEAKLEVATDSYKDLNQELVEDIKALHADRVGFLLPLLANVIESQAQFHAEMSRILGGLLKHTETVDRSSFQERETVLTPKDKSSVSKIYEVSVSSANSSGSKSGSKGVKTDTKGSKTDKKGAKTDIKPPTDSVPKQPTRPPMAARPTGGNPQARVLWDFQGIDATELNVKQGEIITILDKSNPEWWRGETQGGVQGLLPSNYVQLI